MLCSTRAWHPVSHACGSPASPAVISTSCKQSGQNRRCSLVACAAATEEGQATRSTSQAPKAAERRSYQASGGRQGSTSSQTQRTDGSSAYRADRLATGGDQGSTSGQTERRRRCDVRIYTKSGFIGPAQALLDKLEEREGAFVLDAVGVEALPNTVMALARVATACGEKRGKHITVQPFGSRVPLAFSIAYSALETPPALPEPTMRVSAKTDVKKLSLYLMESVVMNRTAVLMQLRGTSALTTALMAIGALRSRINWENLVDDLYMSVLPTTEFETGVPNANGKMVKKMQYNFALYPCGRERDNNPRFTGDGYVRPSE